MVYLPPIFRIPPLIAAETGSVLRFETSPSEAVRGADVLYTDVWVSTGDPVSVRRVRIAALSPYQVNAALMAVTGYPDTVFMHCLPAYHDLKTQVGREMRKKLARDSMEIPDEVFESESSIIFREAENHMHTIKAVMTVTL